ncbi:hypothetical protein evm_011582 [Chilo suppressalis]|nr:hypothetical protein evm_011582 [Chilo suppressalis]
MGITRSAMDKMRKIWRNRNITKATKTKLVRTLIFPIFLYAAETWTLRDVERQKVDALEMWCWRRMLGVSWTEFRTNVSILQELGIRQRLFSTVQSRILTFFGHVSRRNNLSIERLVVQGKVEGTDVNCRWSPVAKIDDAVESVPLEPPEEAQHHQKESQLRQLTHYYLCNRRRRSLLCHNKVCFQSPNLSYQKMKTVVALCAVLAVAMARPETYNSQYDNFDAQELVSNPRLLKNYGMCFLGKGPCTSEGKDFKSTIPDALKTECSKCSPKQRVLIRTVVKGFQEKLPDIWSEIFQKYDPNGEYKEAFERFLNSSD